MNAPPAAASGLLCTAKLARARAAGRDVTEVDRLRRPGAAGDERRLGVLEDRAGHRDRVVAILPIPVPPLVMSVLSIVTVPVIVPTGRRSSR